MLIEDVLVVDGRVLREDRDAALALELVDVHHALGDALVRAEGAALMEQGVDERGLAVIDVSDDGDVTSQRIGNRHLSSLLQTGEQRLRTLAELFVVANLSGETPRLFRPAEIGVRDRAVEPRLHQHPRRGGDLQFVARNLPGHASGTIGRLPKRREFRGRLIARALETLPAVA